MKRLTLSERESEKTALGIAAFLGFLILLCLCTELFCQDQLRTGISVNVIADERINPLDERIFDYLDVYLNPLNIFSYFTQLSNTLTAIWTLLFTFSSIFGWKKVAYFCNKPLVLVSLTTYVTIAGGAVAVTLIFGLSQLQKVINAWSVVYNLLSVVYHFVAPICMWILCRLLPCERTLPRKSLPFFYLFPVVYSAFTLVRGLLIHPGMFPYFIFNPDNVSAIFGGASGLSPAACAVVMTLIFLLGAVLFSAIGYLVFRFRSHPSAAPADSAPSLDAPAMSR